MPSKTDKDIQDIGIDNDNDVDLEVDQDVDLEVDLEVDQETDRDTDIHQQDQDQDIQNKYKIPTRNEQLKFKENELFSSVLFKLKIDEMLSEINVNYSSKLILNIRKILFSLKNFMCDEMDSVMVHSTTTTAAATGHQTRDTNVFTLDQVLQIQEKYQIRIPLIHKLSENSLLKFKFVKCRNLFVVGSFIHELLVKKQNKKSQNIDLVFEMPEECFQEKDHLNYRYFYKRSFYLSMLAIKLNEKFGSLFRYEFEYFQNDGLRPILVLHSTEENPIHFSKKGYSIRLLPQMPSSVFPLSKLSPQKNNIRPVKGAQDSSTSSQPLFPTPLYNSSIMQDVHMSKHTDALHESLQSCSENGGMKNAIMLFKVWIEQRRFSGDRVGYEFNGFLVSLIMTWLMTATKGKRINKGFSSYQIFKITMDVLAKHNFDKSPLFLTPSSAAIENSMDFSAQAFLQNFEVAIVDSTGTYNLASSITKSAMNEIQYEARLTLQFLQDASRDRFDDIFLKNVHREWIKYDNVFRIPRLHVPSSPFIQHHAGLSSVVEEEVGNSVFVDRGRLAISNLFRVLSMALTDRVGCIAVWTSSTSSWSVNSPPPNLDLKEEVNVDADGHQVVENIMIGMVLDPESSLRQVEHGPLSNDKEGVHAFTSLWGPRSETRRFQDGSIRECVVFETDASLAQKSVIVARMTAFLLLRHFKVNEDDGVVYWAGLGGRFISLPSPSAAGKVKQGLVKSFTPVMDAMQAVLVEIKALELPLAIHRVHVCSDSLSYCSVFIPQPVEEHDFASRCSIPEILIEFENSGKWPDDVGAIETMKRAFYIQIATLLQESETGATVMVQQSAMDDQGMDTWLHDSTAATANESFLQITHASGYSFNIRIHHPRVVFLVERAIKATGSDFKAKAPLLAFQKSYMHRFVAAPMHYHAIGNLCLRFPFLGVTIRLAKRWMAAHLLLGRSSNCISEKVVELICARVYTTATAFGTPSSGWTGFVRFLDLVQSWNWGVEPLIVELQIDSAMSISVQDEINANFATLAAQRGGVNSPLLFVATEMDTKSSWFGSVDVSTKIVQRMCLLAKQSLHVVRDQLLTGNNNDVSQLFSTSFDGYDAVIHLDSTQIARYFESVQFDPKMAPQRTSKFKNLMDAHDRQFLAHSHIDLVQLYLGDLVSHFGELAMFFADIYGGDKIAVVWKRQFLEPGPFKINLPYLATVSLDGKTMSADKMALLAEMTRLGGVLVVGVDLK